MKTDSRETLIAQCVVIVVLLIALVPGYPSGYYVLLRFVICAICAYLAVTAYRSKKLNWVWLLGGLAVLYNPLVPVRLNRAVWFDVYFVTIVLIGLSIWMFFRDRKPTPVPMPVIRHGIKGEYVSDATGYDFNPTARTLRCPDGTTYSIVSACRSGSSDSTFSLRGNDGEVFTVTLRGLVVAQEIQQSSPIEKPTVHQCKRCGQMKITQPTLLKENISYFFARRERTFDGHLCLSCMTKTFSIFEIRTLVGTWWGIIGMFVGPSYLLWNLGEYVKHLYRYARRK